MTKDAAVAFIYAQGDRAVGRLLGAIIGRMARELGPAETRACIMRILDGSFCKASGCSRFKGDGGPACGAGCFAVRP